MLAAANLVALYFVIRPIGGSAQELAQQALDMHSAIRQQQGVLDRTRLLASKIESGRGEGDQFMGSYFLPRRTAYSTIMAELNDLAGQAKITPRDSALALDAVDGSDNLDMMQISANFGRLVPGRDPFHQPARQVGPAVDHREPQRDAATIRRHG